MSEEHFYEKIRSHLSLTDEVLADGKISAKEATLIFGKIIGAGRHFIAALNDDDPNHFETLVTDCERIYDEFLAPFDIEFIPPYLEGIFDESLRMLIRPALKLARSMHYSIETE